MAGLKTPGAILISGRGSNMAALIAAARAPGYPVTFRVVLSDRVDAPGLDLARQAGITARAIPRDTLTRAAHEALVAAALDEVAAEVVCLAGYMRILSPWFTARFAGRLVNIHPSLLPALPGLDTHRRALTAGMGEHGCTVHLVTEELDAGPILSQARVAVLPGDTAESLAARVLAEEHRIYPAAVSRLVCSINRRDSSAN